MLKMKSILKNIFNIWKFIVTLSLLIDCDNERARATSAFVACVAKECNFENPHTSLVRIFLRWHNIFSIAFLAWVANKRRYMFHTVCIIHYDKFKCFYSRQRIAFMHTPANLFFFPHSQRVYFYFHLSVKLSSNTRTCRNTFQKEICNRGYRVDFV